MAPKIELHRIVDGMPEDLAERVLPILRDPIALAAAADRYCRDREVFAIAAKRVVADHAAILEELAK
jgi:hypothetical protein